MEKYEKIKKWNEYVTFKTFVIAKGNMAHIWVQEFIFKLVEILAI